MRFPNFRLSTLFMAVLIVACALVAIESAMTHRRARRLERKVRSLETLLSRVSPDVSRRNQEFTAVMKVASEHGFHDEAMSASIQAREKFDSDLKARRYQERLDALP